MALDTGVKTLGPSSGEDVVKLVKTNPSEKPNLKKKAKAMLNTFDEAHGSTDSDIVQTYGFEPMDSYGLKDSDSGKIKLKKQ
jgi:hypothetical protein